MRVSYIELLGQKHPICFSLTAVKAMDEAFGGMDGFVDRVKTGSVSQQLDAINTALEILMKAGRIYGSASGMKLPDPLPCAPADLIDLTDGEAVKAIFSVVSADTAREVETVPKNQNAAQGR